MLRSSHSSKAGRVSPARLTPPSCSTLWSRPCTSAGPSRGAGSCTTPTVRRSAPVPGWSDPHSDGPSVKLAPQGRATFAEIQRRYRTDAEFRRSVDRYVSEFERLLGDVVKNDSDAKRTDAYLTSETGKVYTMLAHASGRFDGA